MPRARFYLHEVALAAEGEVPLHEVVLGLHNGSRVRVLHPGILVVRQLERVLNWFRLFPDAGQFVVHAGRHAEDSCVGRLVVVLVVTFMSLVILAEEPVGTRVALSVYSEMHHGHAQRAGRGRPCARCRTGLILRASRRLSSSCGPCPACGAWNRRAAMSS